MDKAIELIVSWIHKNLKNPKLYAMLVILIIITAIIFPYIDANFFLYNRIEKRVDILQSLSDIDTGKVAQFPALQEEYDAILSEMEKQRELSILGTISPEQNVNNISLFKFLSGAALAWIIALFVPFMNTFKDKKSKVLAFLLIMVFGGILGGVGFIIPTIFNPWINYVGYPILQLIVLIALAIKSK